MYQKYAQQTSACISVGWIFQYFDLIGNFSWKDEWYSFKKCSFDMFVWKMTSSWRASHIPLGLVVLQFCKLINTSPVFFPIVLVILYIKSSQPVVISIKAQAHNIGLMQILSLITFNLCRLLPRQIKRCVVHVLFVAAFCWRKRAFYVRIVGVMGIKSVDGWPNWDTANGREYETHKYESKAAGIKWHPWPFLKGACAYDRWFTQTHKLIFVAQGHKNFGCNEKLRPQITGQ